MPATTASGATLRRIPAETANRFLARFDHQASGSSEIALGAFEEHHTLIGVATLTRRCNSSAALVVIVDRARRKLRIGSDLLHAAVSEAGSAGLRRLTASYPSDALAADALFSSSPFLTARRRADGRVTIVLFVPATR